MLIGLIIPGILYLKFSGTPDVAASGVYEEEAMNESKPIKHAKIATKSKSAPKEHAKQHPNYDFYNLLSKPNADVETADSTPARDEKKFALETTSLADYDKADQLKAELALNGIDQVTISKSAIDKDEGYKIVIGPYQTKEEARKTQAILKESQIKSTITVID